MIFPTRLVSDMEKLISHHPDLCSTSSSSSTTFPVKSKFQSKRKVTTRYTATKEDFHQRHIPLFHHLIQPAQNTLTLLHQFLPHLPRIGVPLSLDRIQLQQHLRQDRLRQASMLKLSLASVAWRMGLKRLTLW